MISSENLEIIAKKTLDYIANRLELQTNLDVDLQGLQLTICDDMNQTFLLNFHGPTQQIWLSSPVTGAHRFQWNGVMWISTRTATSLIEILGADILQLFSEIVEL